MLDITYEVGGRKVRPDQFADAFERAVLEGVRDHILSALKDVRDPITGERPKITVKGRNLDNLSITVEGSDALVAEVERRLS